MYLYIDIYIYIYVDIDIEAYEDSIQSFIITLNPTHEIEPKINMIYSQCYTYGCLNTHMV